MQQIADSPRSAGKPSAAGRVWTFVRIVNVRLRFILLMVLVGVVVSYWDSITNYYDRWQRPVQVSDVARSEAVEYYCPMHPNIVRDAPGSCPVCGMPLSQRPKTEQKTLPEGVLARVQLTPLKVQVGRIATTPVAYELLTREIRTVGIVDYDETRRAFIAARIKGRIDKLFVNYVGDSVKKGDPLVWIYSPDLVVAQQELLSSVRSLAERKNASPEAVSMAKALVEAARDKLILWGITPEQVDEIIRRGTAETHLTIFSPMAGIVTEKRVLEGHYVDEGEDLYTVADLSRVWMQVKIFEDQIGGVTKDMAVLVTSNAYPDRVFAGRITFIAYTVDPATRTVAARVEIDNPDYLLKPGMYASAIIRIPVGAVTLLTAASGPATTSAAHDGHGLATATLLAPAGSAAATGDLSRAYLSLTTSLARDKTDAKAVAGIVKEANRLAGHGPEALRRPASAVAEQARQLQGRDIKEQRSLLKLLSKRIIELVRADPPAGATLYVAHCPMAEADWLQTTKAIENPYYGSEMLSCGEITATIETRATSQGERFAVGYFCPVYPDRLFDKPHECPLDKFPIKLARVEKVLAVPESAVIDTGKRKVVYRESAPGIFDMVEVSVAQRAGEFYPVLSGLQPDDRVATEGAFLVDAENRLNPAASVQYFGASGGPQGGGPGGHQH
jgi:membrane fusion protein, copper/silver efflux system